MSKQAELDPFDVKKEALVILVWPQLADFVVNLVSIWTKIWRIWEGLRVLLSSGWVVANQKYLIDPNF